MGIADFFAWIGFGLVVGIIARFFWPGRQPVGCLGTILLGVAGSVVGGFITHALTGDNYHPASWLMSIVGAIIVLWIFSLLRGRSDRY